MPAPIEAARFGSQRSFWLLHLPPGAPRTRLVSSPVLRPGPHVCFPPGPDHPITVGQERWSISAHKLRKTAWSLLPSSQSRFELVELSGCDSAILAFGSQILSRPDDGARECN